MLLAIAGMCLAGITTYAVTPATTGLARRLGIFDHPGGYKQQAGPIPYLGGLAILGGLLLGGWIPALIGAAHLPTTFVVGYVRVIVIAIALGLVGLIDDVRGLSRWIRVLAQVVAALGAWGAGFRVAALPWDAVNLLVTVVWIVGITNAFNLLDNMDGLSAGVAGVGALSFAAMGVTEGLPGAAVAAAIAGASFGFLAHNRHPARVYMGDAGSTFLGFLLAVIGMRLRFDGNPEVTFLVPVVVLGLPIFDTTLVVMSRVRHRRPIFKGARDHVSHRLIAIGLPVKAAVGLLYFCGLCLGWLGLVISRSNVEVGWMLLGLVMTIALFLGALLWRVPTSSNDPGFAPIEVSAVDPDELAT